MIRELRGCIRDLIRLVEATCCGALLLIAFLWAWWLADF